MCIIRFKLLLNQNHKKHWFPLSQINYSSLGSNSSLSNKSTVFTQSKTTLTLTLCQRAQTTFVEEPEFYWTDNMGVQALK